MLSGTDLKHLILKLTFLPYQQQANQHHSTAEAEIQSEKATQDRTGQGHQNDVCLYILPCYTSLITQKHNILGFVSDLAMLLFQDEARVNG